MIHERLNTLLMVVCIAYLTVFTVATFQNKLQSYLPKFLRKDRIIHFCLFQIGLRAFLFFIKQYLRIFPQYINNYYINNYQQFICVQQ